MSTSIFLAGCARQQRLAHRLVPAIRSEFPLLQRLSQSQHRCFAVAASRFAKVDHSDAYECAMEGRHGKQLSLATIDGIGKDDPPFDPFLEYEMDQEASDHEDDYDDDEEEEGEDYDEEEPLYNNDGSVRYSQSQLAEFRAGAPAGGVFAIISLAGTQHKITIDDLIVSAKLKPVALYSVGSVHTLTDILLAGSSYTTLVGMPTVSGAEVDFMVEEITRDAKVIVFKKRRRKHSKRKNGFRRDVTMLRILDIRLPKGTGSVDHHHLRVPPKI